MKISNKLMQSANTPLRTPKISLTLIAIFKVIWQRLIYTFCKGNELQVWKKRDRLGYTYWHAYDPATGYSSCFGSEAEMRVWIEQHYYRGN